MVVGGNIGEVTTEKSGLMSSFLLKSLVGYSIYTSSISDSLYCIHKNTGNLRALGIEIECTTSRAKPFTYKVGIKDKYVYAVCLNSNKEGIEYGIKLYKGSDDTLYVRCNSYCTITVRDCNLVSISDTKVRMENVSLDLIPSLQELVIN